MNVEHLLLISTLYIFDIYIIILTKFFSLSPLNEKLRLKALIRPIKLRKTHLQKFDHVFQS